MREPGFYWVEFCGEWTVAQLVHSRSKYCWWTVNDEDVYCEDDFEEIDENRIIRKEEPK